MVVLKLFREKLSVVGYLWVFFPCGNGLQLQPDPRRLFKHRRRVQVLGGRRTSQFQWMELR